MSAQLSYQVESPAPRQAWLSLMDKDPESLPYQSPTWFDCILANGNYKDASRYYKFANGNEMVMPMVRRAGAPSLLGIESDLDRDSRDRRFELGEFSVLKTTCRVRVDLGHQRLFLFTREPLRSLDFLRREGG